MKLAALKCGHPEMYFDGERCRICQAAKASKQARLDRTAAEMRQKAEKCGKAMKGEAV